MLNRSTFISVFSAMLLAATPLGAANAQSDTRQFSQAAADVVNKTMRLADDSKYEAALGELQALLGKGDLNPYERATLYQMVGQYSYELGHVGEAQRAFEDAIESGGLPGDDADDLKVVIAQLMIANGQYSEGAARLEDYLASGGAHKPQYVDLIVNARVQSEDYAGALPWAEKWFDSAAPKQRKHYDLMNFLYNNLGMPEDQLRIVKEMIDLWPQDRTLWLTWAAILTNSEREGEAFEVYKMMYQAGHLADEEDLLRVVQYYKFHEMPYQAAEFLKLEIEAGRISGTPENLIQTAAFYRQAREPEQGIPFLESAAKLSDDIDLHIDLGKTLSSAGACDKSKVAFDAAINQGYDAAKAHMLIGNCYVEHSEKLNRLSCDMSDAQRQVAPITISRDAALKAFKAVPKNSRESQKADKWVRFIDAEIQADERRCDMEWHDVSKELCLMKIKQAYDAEVFSNEFKLEDESCQKYIVEYNATYRRPYSE